MLVKYHSVYEWLIQETGWEGVPPSGGSLEIGNSCSFLYTLQITSCSPFGGIPRNWKLVVGSALGTLRSSVPPSGGSLEIGNDIRRDFNQNLATRVPPSGGSLEIGNNKVGVQLILVLKVQFPLRGDP